MKRTGATPAGFTLLELTVVLGLLGVFSVFLVQLLAGAVSLFDEGESSQELSDRAAAAADAVRESIEALAGPSEPGLELDGVSARLLVEQAPLGLGDPRTAALVQVVRATVHVDAATESELWRRLLLERARDTATTTSPEDVAQRLEELVEQAPRHGRALMLLLPWPAGDPDGAFLELRRGWLAPEERIDLGKRRQVGLFEMPLLETGEVDRETILAVTEPIAVGLLHVELAFASQFTRDWSAPPGHGGPEYVWDSARAGLLAAHEDPRRRFSLDLGPGSAGDPRDDVFPRWVRVTLVVGQPNRFALLASDLGVEDREARLIGTERLGDLEEADHVKIDGEWVRFTSHGEDRIGGLQRGVRGTRAAPHAAGARVRVGRTVVLYLKIPHGKDAWNG